MIPRYWLIVTAAAMIYIIVLEARACSGHDRPTATTSRIDTVRLKPDTIVVAGPTTTRTITAWRTASHDTTDVTPLMRQIDSLHALVASSGKTIEACLDTVVAEGSVNVCYQESTQMWSLRVTPAEITHLHAVTLPLPPTSRRAGGLQLTAGVGVGMSLSGAMTIPILNISLSTTILELLP
jgi:hypothetical protein